jgi:hypothetical protein
MADEERPPIARHVFRILAGGNAVVCFILAAWFALGPDWRDAGLMPYIFLASGVVMAGLALTGKVSWWAPSRNQGGPA